jgi:hypothetical protein
MKFDSKAHIDQLKFNNQRKLGVESTSPIKTEMESHLMMCKTSLRSQPVESPSAERPPGRAIGIVE